VAAFVAGGPGLKWWGEGMCDIGEMSQSELEARIARYEAKYGVSSEELLQQVRDGTAPDTFDHMAYRDDT